MHPALYKYLSANYPIEELKNIIFINPNRVKIKNVDLEIYIKGKYLYVKDIKNRIIKKERIEN